MRARHPDREDFVVRDGVKVAFDVYENAGPTILLMPTWSIIHSRHWKMQVPYLARHFRVVTFDGRGNGRSDRPIDPDAYSDAEVLADAVAVLDASRTQQTVVAGVSLGGHWAALLAGRHSDRVLGAVLIGAGTALVPPLPERAGDLWDEELDTEDGWAKYNRHYWRRNYSDFVEFFFDEAFSESHSTKHREDAVRWAHHTDAETLIITELGDSTTEAEEREALASIRCPVLVIHGTEDHIVPHSGGQALAEATGGTFLSIAGGGHCPQARDPVPVNLAMRGFVESLTRTTVTA